MIWIQSVFNGKDFDNAYRTARKIAINKEYDRSLLLCEYILSKIPRHADTEILMGRVYSWKQDFENAIKVLTNVVEKYPEYEDGYHALMDALYWSDNNDMVYKIKELAQKNSVNSVLLKEKMERSIKRVQANKLEKESKRMDQSTALAPTK
jgi:cytochrome c-type biogenesis protein CcmH/NrfG